jgi:hypothetical protein
MEAQIKHYENKLAFEIDPSDLFDALNKGEKIIALDARKPFGFEAEHIPRDSGSCSPLYWFMLTPCSGQVDPGVMM